MTGTDNPHTGVTPSDHHDLTKEEKTISPSERERSISTARRAVLALFALGLLLLFSMAGVGRAIADDTPDQQASQTALPEPTTFLVSLPTLVTGYTPPPGPP